MEAALAAGLWIAAGVLGWAGVSKITRPAGTRTALRLAGLPSSSVAVRSLGGAEIAVAMGALTVGGRFTALPVAAAYLVLTFFSHRQRRLPQASCGCFGDTDAPLTAVHVLVNGTAALVASAAVAADVPGVLTMSASWPVAFSAAVSTAAATFLVSQCMTSVPRLAERMVAPRRVGA